MIDFVWIGSTLALALEVGGFSTQARMMGIVFMLSLIFGLERVIERGVPVRDERGRRRCHEKPSGGVLRSGTC